MLHTLIESGSHAARPVAEGAASFVVHLALVGAALVATRTDGLDVPDPEKPPLEMYLAPTVTPARATVSPAAPRERGSAALVAPELPYPPLSALPSLPPVTLGSRSVDPRIFSGVRSAAAIGVPSLTGGGGSDSAPLVTSESADEPPRMLDAGPLQSPAGLEGISSRVLLEFVVDTLGRAEPATVRIIESGGAPFDASARTAIVRARFAPGRAGSRTVRVLVRQRVVFAGSAAPGHR